MALWMCGPSDVLLCRTSQVLSGWMEMLVDRHFHVSPQMQRKVQSWFTKAGTLVSQGVQAFRCLQVSLTSAWTL